MTGTSAPGWTFLTNHAHVLLCVVRDPETRMRDIATQVGITERAVQLIIADLAEAGYLERTRVGRRNHYRIHPELPLRHRLERGHPVGELLEALAGPVAAGPGEAAEAAAPAEARP